MDENSNSYRQVYGFEEKKPSRVKNIFIPFISGVLGASLVVGICFGIPGVRNNLFSATSNTNTSGTVSTSTSPNTNLVSLSSYSDTGVAVAAKILPSIVGITVEYTLNSQMGFFGQAQSGQAKAEGSGVIIRSDGYILTNNHVVSSNSDSSFYQLSEATKVTVYLYNDETPYTATIVGTDAETDLAVIKIDKTDLTPAELGNSDDVKVGEFAMAAGNPLGLQSTTTSGSISAVNRQITDNDGKTYSVLQTDAAINSGNSGGALVNSAGQVIGINTLKLSGSGIEGMGFAIPINSTIDITNQLIQYNKVKRPYIGITGTTVTESLSQKYNLPIGVYIQSIENFSPAEKSGLKPGDVIIAVDGTEIKTMDELNAIKAEHKIGDTLKLKVMRDNSEKELNLTLAEQP